MILKPLIEEAVRGNYVWNGAGCKPSPFYVSIPRNLFQWLFYDSWFVVLINKWKWLNRLFSTGNTVFEQTEPIITLLERSFFGMHPETRRLLPARGHTKLFCNKWDSALSHRPKPILVSVLGPDSGTFLRKIAKIKKNSDFPEKVTRLHFAALQLTPIQICSQLRTSSPKFKEACIFLRKTLSQGAATVSVFTMDPRPKSVIKNMEI